MRSPNPVPSPLPLILMIMLVMVSMGDRKDRDTISEPVEVQRSETEQFADEILGGTVDAHIGYLVQMVAGPEPCCQSFDQLPVCSGPAKNPICNEFYDFAGQEVWLVWDSFMRDFCIGDDQSCCLGHLDNSCPNAIQARMRDASSKVEQFNRKCSECIDAACAESRDCLMAPYEIDCLKHCSQV